MNCLALPILVVAVLGADQKLPPPIRLETGGETFGNLMPGVTGVVLSSDGKSLFAVVKDGKSCDVATWDIPSKSKTVLTKGAAGACLSPSPDGRSVLGCVAVKGSGDLMDSAVDYFLWDVPTKSKTALPRLKLGVLLATHAFSRDGTLLAIADGDAGKVHLWKRGAAANWSLLRVFDLVQPSDRTQRYRPTTVFTPDGGLLFALFLLLREGKPYAFEFEKWDTFSGRRLDFPIKAIGPQFDLIQQLFFVAGEKTFCIQSYGADAATIGEAASYAGALGVDISSAKRKYNLPVLLTGASVSPDGRTGTSVAVDWARDMNEPSSAVVSLWNFDDGTRLREVTVLAGKVHGGEAVGGDERPFGIFSADSRFFALAAGDAGNHIHVIDVNKAGAHSSRKMPWLDGERVIEIEKAQIAASFAADAPIKGLFLLNSGEIAAVGVEPKAVLIWKIKTP